MNKGESIFKKTPSKVLGLDSTFNRNRMLVLKYIKILMPFILSFFLCSCNHLKTSSLQDPSAHLTREDFKDLTKPSIVEVPPAIPTPIEKEPIELALSKTITLTLNEGAPLKAIFQEISKQADLELELGTNLPPAPTFTAKRRPLKEVLERLCDMLNIRYTLKNGRLRVEKDTPYLKTYNVQFLALSRNGESQISIDTDVFSSVEGSSAAENGSNSLIKGTYSSDFWQELENSLTTLLTQVKQEGLPIPSYSLHKQAGLISIVANQKQHKTLEHYLASLQEAVSSQVLIEAKIVEVALKEEFRSGINWQTLSKKGVYVSSPLGELIPESQTPTRNVFTIGGMGRDFSGLLSLLETFGTVRTLSSPRLTVMNNQIAILKVAENQVYFRVQYDRSIAVGTNNQSTDLITASSTIQTVPIGLLMTVQPAISLATNEVILTLRPTISRVTRSEEDPAVSIVSSNHTKSRIPVVEVRELESVLRMKSGQVSVMGGLMQESSINNTSDVPGPSSIPLFGKLFESHADSHVVTELVIFIKTDILRAPQIPLSDQNLYQKFSKDPRPLSFN